MSIRHWAKTRLTDWNCERIDASQLQAIARGFEVLGKLVDGPDGSPLTHDVVKAARHGDTAPLSVEDWRERIQNREALSDTLKRFGGTSEKLLFAHTGWTRISSGRAVLVLPDTFWAQATIRILRLLARFEETDWATLLEGSASVWVASDGLQSPLQAAPACRKQVRRGHLYTWPVSETNPHLSTLLAL